MKWRTLMITKAKMKLNKLMNEFMTFPFFDYQEIILEIVRE